MQCSACKSAWDPQDSHVRTELCELYKHHSLRNASDLDYNAPSPLTGRDLREMNHTLGLTPACVGKDGLG